jgi:serine phosphatase RsbU (regulator of sigma subunit)
MAQPVLLVVAVACALAAGVWGRSAQRLFLVSRRITAVEPAGSDAAVLAAASYRKELHTAVLYAVLAVASLVASTSTEPYIDTVYVLVVVPVGLSVLFGRTFIAEARLAEDRSRLERRAEEVLSQEDLAPRAWAARLAPEEVPEFAGFEMGSVYQAGTGLMAGDFYDVFRTSPTRLAAVIGDVSGHGIEPSITAFQTKYLLRVFLRQFRDPAQALEELNAQMVGFTGPEEFVSLAVAVFDQAAGTLRYASAGHPPAFFWHDGDARPLRATGPLLTLDPAATYLSREIGLAEGDTLLLYTDGLAEARHGDQLFGDERVAGTLRRDPGVPPAVLCKSLLDAAHDFATVPLSDDVAILAIRKT